jgi:hypothetical protein
MAAATSTAETFEHGRIPFRIRIGVTGHRHLRDVEGVRTVLRGQICRIHDRLAADGGPLGSDVTPVRLAVVSQLADGADRLVVEEVFAEARKRGEEARLEVILPMQRELYEQVQQFSKSSKDEFDRLWSKAIWHNVTSDYRPRAEESEERQKHLRRSAYNAAGRQVIARSDVLVALWNGARPHGRGGTADTLLEAAWRGMPCIWIKAGDLDDPADIDAHDVVDNFGRGGPSSLGVREFWKEVDARRSLTPPREKPDPPSGDALVLLRNAAEALDEFNIASFSGGKSEGSDAWLTPPRRRAAALAKRYQTRFRQFVWTISALVVVAAGMLAASVSFGLKTWLAGAEAGCLVAAYAVFRVMKMRRFEPHSRWLSCRLLAERLRAVGYVAPTYRDFRRVATLEGVYVERSHDWVQRSFEEVWDRRPQAGLDSDERELTAAEVPAIRNEVAEWIRDQIAYHKRNAEKNNRRDRRYSVTATVVLFLAIASAGLHASGQGHEWSLFFSILLPAVAAAIGVLSGVEQHRALARRSEDMQDDLKLALRSVVEADESDLASATVDAARIMSQESGDWYGTMWFIDVDHL